jgi:hypothetical protein
MLLTVTPTTRIFLLTNRTGSNVQQCITMCAGRGRKAPCNISNCKNNLANFCTRPTGGARQNFNILIDLIFGLQMRIVPNIIQFRGGRGGKGGNLCFGLRKTHKISVTRSINLSAETYVALKSEHYTLLWFLSYATAYGHPTL